jgi:hypothetical protein
MAAALCSPLIASICNDKARTLSPEPGEISKLLEEDVAPANFFARLLLAVDHRLGLLSLKLAAKLHTGIHVRSDLKLELKDEVSVLLLYAEETVVLDKRLPKN